jgi:hypothetical protein
VVSSVAVFTTYLLTTHKPFYLHTNHLHASNCLVATYCPTYQLSAWPTSTGCKTIFSNAQYVTLQKYFSHPSLVIYLFATPPMNLKLGQQIRGGTTNSKPPGPIIMMGRSETVTSSQIIFITLFSAGAHCCCTFHRATANCRIMVSQNPFPWAKPRYFDFSSLDFSVQDHILSTSGDALRARWEAGWAEPG